MSDVKLYAAKEPFTFPHSPQCGECGFVMLYDRKPPTARKAVISCQNADCPDWLTPVEVVASPIGAA